MFNCSPQAIDCMLTEFLVFLVSSFFFLIFTNQLDIHLIRMFKEYEWMKFVKNKNRLNHRLYDHMARSPVVFSAFLYSYRIWWWCIELLLNMMKSNKVIFCNKWCRGTSCTHVIVTSTVNTGWWNCC